MLDILFSPGRAFSRLKDRPAWVLPLVLAALLPALISTAAFTLLPRQTVANYIDGKRSQIMDNVGQRLERSGLSQEQREEQMKKMNEQFSAELDRYRTLSKPALFARSLLRSVPAMIWGAGLMFLLALFVKMLLPLVEAQAVYKSVLPVIACAGLTRIVGALFKGIVMVASNKPTVLTSLALAMPAGRGSYLHGLLSFFDVFTLWELALVSLGVGVVTNTRRTWPVVFGVWLIYVLILSALDALAGGMMAGS
jgi:hypothetical protein